MDGLTEGRILHYVIPNGEHRPAIVVRVWPNEFGPGIPGVNLQVFTDGSNDMREFAEGGYPPRELVRAGMFWATSAKFSDTHEPGTCHWIERA